MNKNALKKLAMEARERLLEQVKYRAEYYGIKRSLFDAEKVEPSEVFQLPGNGELLTVGVRAQRDALLARMRARGYEQTLEEAAYTWFNRFIALKYMQEKGRLPVNARALPGERLSDGTLAPPELVYQALEEQRLEGIDPKRVLEYLESSQTEALYKYLLIALCNQLSRSLPRMFEPIDDYTELLCPERLLGEDSVLGMLAEAPADSWEDIQVIGWLYQYYVAKRHDEIVNINGSAIQRDDVPPATCLYTTDWVVRYMVENSLGREFIEGELQGKRFESEKARIAEEKRLSEELGWAYYLPEAEQTAEVHAQLERLEQKRQVEEYTVLDPCMGSGHILVYAFDVLMQLYRRAGYMDREAVRCILEKNLYGLDIDERAAQLAYFALMMKACDYDARFLKRREPTPQPHVQAIREAEQEPDSRWSAGERRAAQVLSEAFADAREYGSILRVDEGVLRAAEAAGADAFSGDGAANAEMRDMAEQARILSGRYDAVIANPPYMNKFDAKLKKFIQGNYADYKADLFSVFIYRNFGLCKDGGYTAFMSPFVWMFIKSYEALRTYILQQKSISTLIQMEYSAFEEATVPICTFVLRNAHADYRGMYLRLSDFKGGMEVQRQKVLEAQAMPSCPYRYAAQQDNFSKIPGSPIAYWVGERVVECFGKGVSVDNLSDFTGSQHITADNDKYLRLLWEVDRKKVGINKKWAQYAKGGEYRKWYGNIVLCVEQSNEAMEFYKANPTSNCLNERYWFTEGITYSAVTSKGTGFRVYPAVGAFDKGGATMCYVKHFEYVLAFLNTKIAERYLSLLNPTINLQIKDVKAVPVILAEGQEARIAELTKQQVAISKKDWDSLETSWDFKKHPMI